MPRGIPPPCPSPLPLPAERGEGEQLPRFVRCSPAHHQELPAMTQAAVDVESEALRGRDMLCFSHDWTGDPLSKTHVMRILSRDNRILWVNSIGYRAPSASRRDIK